MIPPIFQNRNERMLSNMIGIIGAMEIEIEGLRAKLEDAQSETVSGIRFDWGTINGTPCTLAVCGPGKVNAAVCAQTMILRFHPQLVINSGVAGGIGPDVHIKDVVIATAVVQHDMDTSPLGDPVGLISGLNIIEIPADKTAAEVLTRKAHEVYEGNVFHGIIATGDQFMADRSKIAAIAEQFHAMACEMEGGAIGQVCYRNGVPFGILRCISDDITENEFMDYLKFRKIAAEKSIAVIKAFLSQL